MIGKLIATTILLLLAFYAFWGDALGTGYLINPFGIIFLLLAAVTWFKWEVVREAFRPAKDQSNIPTIDAISGQIGGMFLSGKGRRSAARRRISRDASSDPSHDAVSPSRGRSVRNMIPGSWVIISSGRDSSATACGVTPQAQKTGTSPGRISTGSP
jgi:hypothetical protein